ncbi:methyltransferase [Roseicitreum antarcticum]|uniref:Demethylspheroidene O-methyltransferase n=1 Tax=Roseicitreum antarcticum TaxID=564137 RepID=A0A1H2REI9_9RHOB|nr:methyltransferase [Roseicitreum antarcticum]SDW17913.1 demethylspheroidene O-methyltransferase [Roseicitreum antarcticum]
MAFDQPTPVHAPTPQGWRGRLNRLVGRPAFQAWAARFPLTRRRTRAEGSAIFDLMSGFVYSQVLFALVELDLLIRLRDTPLASGDLPDLPAQRMEALLLAATALGLMRRTSGEKFQTSLRGAAIPGVPGLTDMIRHHAIFYRDMADPLAVLRGEKDTELAHFWPYVFGADSGIAPADAGRYSQLMADSQALVAMETLTQTDLRGAAKLMDIGGGSGVFLQHVAQQYPELSLELMDLPQVMDAARARLAQHGLGARVALHPGSFRDDAIPGGADAMSLIRVLYDHDDATVDTLLAQVFAALPAGGRLIISEPMAGGAHPNRSGDAYFAFYTMAMRTGRARSQAEIAQRLTRAGFTGIQTPRPARAFVTSVVTARKP